MKFRGFNGEEVTVTKKRYSKGDHDHLIIQSEGHQASLHILIGGVKEHALKLDIFQKESKVVVTDFTLS